MFARGDQRTCIPLFGNTIKKGNCFSEEIDSCEFYEYCSASNMYVGNLLCDIFQRYVNRFIFYISHYILSTHTAHLNTTWTITKKDTDTEFEQLLGHACSHTWREETAVLSSHLVSDFWRIGRVVVHHRRKVVLNNQCWGTRPTNSVCANSF